MAIFNGRDEPPGLGEARGITHTIGEDQIGDPAAMFATRLTERCDLFGSLFRGFRSTVVELRVEEIFQRPFDGRRIGGGSTTSSTEPATDDIRFQSPVLLRQRIVSCCNLTHCGVPISRLAARACRRWLPRRTPPRRALARRTERRPQQRNRALPRVGVMSEHEVGVRIAVRGARKPFDDALVKNPPPQRDDRCVKRFSDSDMAKHEPVGRPWGCIEHAEVARALQHVRDRVASDAGTSGTHSS